MFKIDMELINTLVKGDKVLVSWYSKDGTLIEKRCTFHSVDGIYILVKPPRIRKRAWEIKTDSETKIERTK